MEERTIEILSDEETGGTIKRTYMVLTVDEEYAFAKFWMDILCERFIQTKEDFLNFLLKTFYRKAMGKDFTREELQEWIVYVDLYSSQIKTQPSKWITKPSKTSMYPPNSKTTPEERKEWYNKTISGIWWETWQHHPIREHNIIDIFPGKGMDEVYIASQVKKEREYWERLFEEAKYIQGWDFEPILKATKEMFIEQGKSIDGDDIETFHALVEYGNTVCGCVKAHYKWDMKQIMIDVSDFCPRGKLIYPD